MMCTSLQVPWIDPSSVALKKEDFYREHDIEVLTDTTVNILVE
jgi:hypothetical protein